MRKVSGLSIYCSCSAGFFAFFAILSISHGASRAECVAWALAGLCFAIMGLLFALRIFPGKIELVKEKN